MGPTTVRQALSSKLKTHPLAIEQAFQHLGMGPTLAQGPTRAVGGEQQIRFGHVVNKLLPEIGASGQKVQGSFAKFALPAEAEKAQPSHLLHPNVLLPNQGGSGHTGSV
eukprot:1161354-Pelagomonas_calceolata.AAC.6